MHEVQLDIMICGQYFHVQGPDTELINNAVAKVSLSFVLLLGLQKSVCLQSPDTFLAQFVHILDLVLAA